MKRMKLPKEKKTDNPAKAVIEKGLQTATGQVEGDSSGQVVI